MNFFALLKSVYVEERVADETIWHKRLRAPWFTRTVGGSFISDVGQIWRRKRNGKWEYQQDEEALEEFERPHLVINQQGEWSMEVPARELRPGMNIEIDGTIYDVASTHLCDGVVEPPQLCGGIGLKTAVAIRILLSDGRSAVVHPSQKFRVIH